MILPLIIQNKTTYGRCLKWLCQSSQEEYLSNDEQIVPSKIKFSEACLYNPKKPKKYYLFCPGTNNPKADYDDLQKSAQVLARLSETYWTQFIFW